MWVFRMTIVSESGHEISGGRHRGDPAVVNVREP
jgi:hypothetical protein